MFDWCEGTMTKKPSVNMFLWWIFNFRVLCRMGPKNSRSSDVIPFRIFFLGNILFFLLRKVELGTEQLNIEFNFNSHGQWRTKTKLITNSGWLTVWTLTQWIWIYTLNFEVLTFVNLELCWSCELLEKALVTLWNSSTSIRDYQESSQNIFWSIDTGCCVVY